MSINLLPQARTLLFVPGNRPERFNKAYAAGADMVILDLEDSVAANQKSIARAAVKSWLDPSRPVMVRINPVGSQWFQEDLVICDHPGVSAIALPRAEPCPELAGISSLRPVLAIVETAVGVQHLTDIARIAGVERLSVGIIDLAFDLGMPDAAALSPILLQFVLSSRAAGIASPIAPVTTEIHDGATILRDAINARSLGFSGKLCIHPSQISFVIAGLRPSETEISNAIKILAAAEKSGGSAIMLDGRMIDRPIVDHARRVLASVS